MSGPFDFGYLRALRALFHAERPSIVHAHSFDSGLYCATALRGLPARLVTTFHGASDVTRRGFRNRIKWLAFRRANALVCVSASLSALAKRTPGVNADRVRTILNGVDFARLSAMRSESLRSSLQLPPDTLLLGALGNIRAPKGYNLLLPAIAQLRSEGFNVHLAIAGDDRGDLADALRAQRAALGLDASVTLLGYQSDPAAFLEGLDLFVLSSTSEGFSLATVQAMAAELPIVATRSGGPEELLSHDVHGWLVAAGSSTALRDGIATLIADPARRARLAASARSRALENFSIETMISRYQALYDELLAR
jgi:glycosyltransferase involved in cell wall biosynthesis